MITKKTVEIRYPFLGAMVVLLLLLIMKDDVAYKFEAEAWQSVWFYTAVLIASAIQGRFGFAIYRLVMTRDHDFLEKIKDTGTMSRFIDYISKANSLAFTVTIFTVPLIFTDPAISGDNDLVYFIAVTWFAVFIWSLLAFLRVAWNFRILTGILARTGNTGFNKA